jgi:CheY-like chemotaxis protein
MDILIVEDEAILSMAYEKQLRDMGYQDVGMAFSGEEALASVELDLPKMILLDIKIRGEMNGIEVAEKIRRHHDIPIVYITAYSDPETLKRAQRTDPVRILGKVSGDLELPAVVSEIFSQKPVIPVKKN